MWKWKSSRSNQINYIDDDEARCLICVTNIHIVYILFVVHLFFGFCLFCYYYYFSFRASFSTFNECLSIGRSPETKWIWVKRKKKKKHRIIAIDTKRKWNLEGNSEFLTDNDFYHDTISKWGSKMNIAKRTFLFNGIFIWRITASQNNQFQKQSTKTTKKGRAKEKTIEIISIYTFRRETRNTFKTQKQLVFTSDDKLNKFIFILYTLFHFLNRSSP